jgi:hypothetical protein
VVVNNLGQGSVFYTQNPPVGVACQANAYSGQPRTGGEKTQIPAAVYLQLRQPATFQVTQLGAGGSVADVEGTNLAYGVNDYYVLQNGAPVTGGSGSGCKLLLNRSADGRTIFDSISSGGSGYQIGDILTFTPPIGNGCNGAPQSVTTVTGFSTGTLDSYWDVLLQGVASRGASNVGADWNNAGNTWNGDGRPAPNCSGNGGGRKYSLYPAYTASMSANYCSDQRTYLNGGGGGWGPGVRGNNSCCAANTAGGNGAAYVNEMFIPDWVSRDTTYATPRTVDVYVNSSLATTIPKACQAVRLS